MSSYSGGGFFGHSHSSSGHRGHYAHQGHYRHHRPRGCLGCLGAFVIGLAALGGGVFGLVQLLT